MGKERLIEVAGEELDRIKAAGLGAPHTYSNRVGSVIHFWVNAEEYRAWKSLEDTSGVPHG